MKTSHAVVVPSILAALLAAQSAMADPSTMVVRIKRLNLSSQAGASIALQRMSDSARAFCAGGVAAGPQEMDVTTIVCRRDMTARAVRKLGAPPVTRLYMAGPAYYQMAAVEGAATH